MNAAEMMGVHLPVLKDPEDLAASPLALLMLLILTGRGKAKLWKIYPHT